MIKIGICSSWDDKARLAAIKDAGADYAELNLNGFFGADPAKVREMIDYLSTIGLPVRAYNGMFPWAGMRVTGDGVDDGAIAAYLDEVLTASDPLGAEYVVFGSSGARKMLDGDTRGRAQAQIYHLLEDLVIPAMEAHGRTAVIEPLNPKEDNLVNTVADGMMYVKTIAHPRVREMADFYHCALSGEDIAGLARFRDDILHCHIASPSNGRHAPLPGDGDDAFYRLCFDTLKSFGYDGGVSVEGGWGEDFTAEAKRSVCYLKSLI